MFVDVREVRMEGGKAERGVEWVAEGKAEGGVVEALGGKVDREGEGEGEEEEEEEVEEEEEEEEKEEEEEEEEEEEDEVKEIREIGVFGVSCRVRV